VRRVAAALAVALIACGKSGEQAPAPGTCAAAATSGVDAMVKRAHDRLAKAQLPAEVIDCYGKVSSMEELRGCRSKLTPEQQTKVQRDEQDLFAGAMGPPGFGPQGAAHAAAAAATSPEITRLETEVRGLNARLAALQNKANTAATDADRKVAQQEVLRLQQELEAANKALESARADAGSAGSAATK
jgi:hypothetical protein